MDPISTAEMIVIAGGTWSGYAPVQAALSARTDAAYALRLGLSDEERVNLMTRNEAAGVFITPQAFAEMENSLVSLELVVIHVFAQTASAAGGEHILVNPEARSQRDWRWAIPSRGFENAIVCRVDPEASSVGRILRTRDRSSSILAVARGEADACVADVSYAKSVVGEIPWRLDPRPLPDEIWRDLWTVLVVPRGRLSADSQSLRSAVRQLSIDARSARPSATSVGHYLSLEESRHLILTGQVLENYRRWGGVELASTGDLLT